MLRPVAVAIKMQTDPGSLLNSYAQGWQLLEAKTLSQCPTDANGVPIATVEAFQWVDITLFGWGNTDSAAAQLQQQIKARGSSLYAYAMFTQTNYDALGIKAVSYRLVLLHSFVELAEWAVAIVAIAFAAIIFLQYLTTGQSPALKDLQNLWGSAVASVGTAASGVAGSVTNTYLGWVAAAGGIALAFGLIAKNIGVKAPPGPRVGGSVGVRAGPVSGRLSS